MILNLILICWLQTFINYLHWPHGYLSKLKKQTLGSKHVMSERFDI